MYDRIDHKIDYKKYYDLIPLLLSYVLKKAVDGDGEARRVMDKWDKEKP